MKVLFVGPYPPPHGGISVHVSSAHARMKRAGQQSGVLNIDPRAPESHSYIKISGGADLVRQLVRHAWNDWLLNVHINGHNAKGWAIALVCGIVSQCGPGAMLTLHSGMAPAYVRNSPRWNRQLMRLSCMLYRQVTCVNTEIASALSELGMRKDQIRIVPAFFAPQISDVIPPPYLETWLLQHSPVMTATMFFRPEYGFELLVQAVSRLRSRHPAIGCLIMGTGEDHKQAADLVARHGLTEAMLLAGDVDHDLCLQLKIGRAHV